MNVSLILCHCQSSCNSILKLLILFMQIRFAVHSIKLTSILSVIAGSLNVNLYVIIASSSFFLRSIALILTLSLLAYLPDNLPFKYLSEDIQSGTYLPSYRYGSLYHAWAAFLKERPHFPIVSSF